MMSGEDAVSGWAAKATWNLTHLPLNTSESYDGSFISRFRLLRLQQQEAASPPNCRWDCDLFAVWERRRKTIESEKTQKGVEGAEVEGLERPERINKSLSVLFAQTSQNKRLVSRVCSGCMHVHVASVRVADESEMPTPARQLAACYTDHLTSAGCLCKHLFLDSLGICCAHSFVSGRL